MSFLWSLFTSGSDYNDSSVSLSSQLDTILSGDIESLVDAVQETLLLCDCVQFHPKNGFTEASFAALFLHHLRLLRGDNVSIELRPELYLKESNNEGRFVDLWLHDSATGRAVLFEFKFVRLSFLLLPHTEQRLLTGSFDDRRNLRRACNRLSQENSPLHSDNLYYKDYNNRTALVSTVRGEAMAQARHYAGLLSRNQRRVTRLTLASIVGYGNRITFETQPL